MYNMRPTTYPAVATRLFAIARKVTRVAGALKAFSVLESYGGLEEQGIHVLEDIEKDIKSAEEWLVWAKAQVLYLKKGDWHIDPPVRPTSYIH